MAERDETPPTPPRKAWVAPLDCVTEAAVATGTGPSASPGNDGAGPFSAS